MNQEELAAWMPLLQAEFQKPYWPRLCQAVEAAYDAGTVYPSRPALFRALRLTAPAAVRVVILGQDPYHTPGMADGLAFSVPSGAKLPPSLRNIYRELQEDLGLESAPESGSLTGWAGQGVLLLNTVLTVAEGRANAHKDLGWQRFTDAVIAACGRLEQPVAFVLWGAQAQKKAPLCQTGAGPRLILQAAHPSPLSSFRGFFGSRPFSQINRFLTACGEAPIDWANTGCTMTQPWRSI